MRRNVDLNCIFEYVIERIEIGGDQIDRRKGRR